MEEGRKEGRKERQRDGRAACACASQPVAAAAAIIINPTSVLGRRRKNASNGIAPCRFLHRAEEHMRSSLPLVSVAAAAATSWLAQAYAARPSRRRQHFIYHPHPTAPSFLPSSLPEIDKFVFQLWRQSVAAATSAIALISEQSRNTIKRPANWHHAVSSGQCRQEV
jgi:hypothetical protein